MKAYIGNVDWADEGNVFFFSIESEERLMAMKELINLFSDLDILGRSFEMYWGTNEWFEFDWADLETFIDKAKDISNKELAVFRKFDVYGFDIYDRIADKLFKTISDCDYELTKEELDEIEPVFLKVFGKEDWESALQDYLNNK